MWHPFRRRETRRELLTRAFALDPDYDPDPYIDYPEDVRHVMGVAWTRLGLSITQQEAYNLWLNYSCAMDSLWMDPNGPAEVHLKELVDQYSSFHLKLHPHRTYDLLP